MKKKIKHIICLVLVLTLGFNANSQAKFDFDKKVHKFGACNEGDQLECVFNFTNSGDEPLIISHYEVSCTCTKAEFLKEPIMPGETGEIKVLFDSNGKMGWQYREILIYSNAKKNPFELEIQTKVYTE